MALPQKPILATKRHKKHKNSGKIICASCAFLWLSFPFLYAKGEDDQ